jgi:heat shock protein HslJ
MRQRFFWIGLMLASYRAYLNALGLGLLVLLWGEGASAARQPTATSWTLKEGRDVPSPQPRKPELRMEGSKLSGMSGCNNFTATLSEEPEKRVAIKQVALTRMLCQEKQNSVETAVVRALEQTRFIDRKGRTLTFLSAEKAPLLVWQSKAASAPRRAYKKAHRRARAHKRAMVRTHKRPSVRTHGCFFADWFARPRHF